MLHRIVSEQLKSKLCSLYLHELLLWTWVGTDVVAPGTQRDDDLIRLSGIFSGPLPSSPTHLPARHEHLHDPGET